MAFLPKLRWPLAWRISLERAEDRARLNENLCRHLQRWFCAYPGLEEKEEIPVEDAREIVRLFLESKAYREAASRSPVPVVIENIRKGSW